MAGTRIEQLIEDIYAFIENCKMQPLSQTKVIVPKDELYDLLDELRLRTPDEIKRYQKIIANRDAIMAQAEANAQAMQNEARERAKVLIDENEIMQQAYAQANEIVELATKQAQDILDSATMEANNVKAGAIKYTDDMLANLENILNHSMEVTTNDYNTSIQNLRQIESIVSVNRAELFPPEAEDEASEGADGADSKLDII